MIGLFANGNGSFSVLSAYDAVLRIAIPVLALLIVLRCARSLLGFKKEPEIWAWLRLADGNLIPVTHWENIIGRKKTADIIVNQHGVAKNHAALSRLDDGSWIVRDIGARGKMKVNGYTMASSELRYGDVLSLGSAKMVLEDISSDERKAQAETRTVAGKNASPGLSLVLLTIFQALCTLSFCLHIDSKDTLTVILGFTAIAAIEWFLFIGQKIINRSGFEVETLALFLCTLGLCIVASKWPSNIVKQLISLVLGIIIFLLIGWIIRDLKRAQKFRYVAAVSGVLLLLINLAFGAMLNGAKNWISIGGISLQPSELVKLCFVLFGTSTLDSIVTKKNLMFFIIYAGFVCVCLALMSDFGTALIFFVAFLIISFIRSSSFASVILFSSIAATAGLALLLAVLLDKVFHNTVIMDKLSYVFTRFSTWGHIWEDANGSGYQQTRALMCIASGGFFGRGFGNGWFCHVAASETDLVFAFIGEEGGLFLSLIMVFALVVLGIFVVRSADVARSSFYTISACASMGIMMTQAILNIFGTIDFLPLTGVTFPFVSQGGSSMIASWGLLAFIKACDTRKNASFAVTLSEGDGV